MTSTLSNIERNARDYARIEAAILHLEEHFRDQPGLGEMAEVVGLSPHHFQRLFRRWAGVSPKRFGQFLTLDYAKAQLEASASILDAAFDAGLSGPSRLHDLFITYEAMSPGAFKQGGDGVDYRLRRAPEPLRPPASSGRPIAASAPSASPTTAGAMPRPSASSSSAAGPPPASTRTRTPQRRSPRAFSTSNRQRTKRAPAQPLRHQLPTQGVGGAVAHPTRPNHLLRRPRAGVGPAAFGPCGGRRRRRQPDLVPDSVPSSDPALGPHLQLRVGARAQARHAGLGGGAHELRRFVARQPAVARRRLGRDPHARR